MTTISARRSPAIGSVLIVAFFVLVAFTFPSWFISVGDQAQKVEVYFENDPQTGKTAPPVSVFETNAGSAHSVNGNFTLSVEDNGELTFIYLPYFVGRVLLSADGASFYESSPFRPARTLTEVHNALVAVPAPSLPSGTEPSRNIEISLSLQPDSSGLAVLSEIYFGKQQDFEKPILLNYLYYEVFRNGLLGVQFFLLLIAAALLYQEKYRREISAPIVILCYFIIIGLSGILSSARPDIDFSTLVVSSTLIVSVALLIYGYSVCLGSVKKHHLQILGLTILGWFAMALVMSYGHFSLRIVNIFISGPSLIVSLIGLIGMCFVGMRRSRSDEVVLLLIGSSALFATTLHDVSFRIGLHSNGIVLSPLGSTMFIATLSYSSIMKYFSAQRDLFLANANLNIYLESQSRRLREEFTKTAELLSAVAAQEETSRMTRELHDGVLTYLALISIISESEEVKSIAKMGHLSRLATNEIRVILDTRLNEEASLAIALSSLRQNIVEPLGLKGISVEWSTIALLNYGSVPPKLLMNVVRIIQEAIHNAVVRGNCKVLSITAEEVNSVHYITVSNSGGRRFSDQQSAGLGIKNMKDRAAQIGGAVEIVPEDTGASLTLRLPISKDMSINI